MIPYKPNIFISSTIKDLPNERIAALKAIEEFGGQPLMSEFTINAQNNDSVTACLSKVKESNIYILILGGVYGWQPYAHESITELEYKTAQENNISTLVFNLNCPKEKLQEEFSLRVGATYFWKPVNDAFALKDAILNSIKEEVAKWEGEMILKKEILYANLLQIKFPTKIFIGDLNIDRDEIIQNSKVTKKWLKSDASWFDVAVSAIHQKGISFPHDWTIHKKQIITFHDISDSSLPLSSICDLGTVTPLSCEEFYSQSDAYLSVFKTLLARCLKTKLYKLHVRWYKNEKLFAFMPISKDLNDKWINRKIEWTRKRKATRTVVKITYGTKDPNRLTSARHLAFGTKFHLIDNNWFLSIKPDWLITWGSFVGSKFGFQKIQYIKRKEKNIHVFNHLNFILWYLQPNETIQLFSEYVDYPFLSIENFLTFESWPEIKDDLWLKLESKATKKALEDKNGDIDLFTI